MEINITYETLFDLLRKERSLEELQQLDPVFWNHVVDYLSERHTFLEKTSQTEQEKTKLQLQNIKRILKEVYERREQKIVNLALNVIRSDASTFVDKKNMLSPERELFDETLLLLTKYKQGVLLQVFQYRLPIIATTSMPNIYAAPPPDPDVLKKELVAAETNGDGEEQTESKPDEASKEQTSSSDKPSLPGDMEPKTGSVIVKFTASVPKFYGKNKTLFGPYDEGKIVQLPANIANILLKKGKVKQVMA